MSKAQKTAYVKLADSEKAAPEGTDTQNLDPEQSMEVTVRIRRKESLDSHLEQGKRYSREEYANLRAQADVESIVARYGDAAFGHFARQMASLDPDRRRRLQRLARES